jgi:ABC-2 type transport system ATP-binding protein
MRLTILRLHRELGLTILLSSHLLNEIEQLCTRIAVLKQGRMVFEGTLAATRQRDDWVRLKTGDFPSAVGVLREAQFIKQERDGQFIALNPGVGTDQVVRLLVERSMPVYEIAHEEETLESFYLTLMNGGRSAPPPVLPGSGAAGGVNPGA